MDPDAGRLCYNQLDRVGVAYVCPNSAQDKVFEVCDSDNQDFVGVYTTNGVTTMYTQPPESLGPITTMPYTARIPASSNCVQYQSTDLYPSLPAPTGVATSSGSGSGSAAPAASTGKSGATSPSGSRTGSATGAAPTGGSAANSGAGALRTSAFATVAGIVFAVALFA